MPTFGLSGVYDPLDARLSDTGVYCRAPMEICPTHFARYQQGHECPDCVAQLGLSQSRERLEPPGSSMSTSRIFSSNSVESRRDFHESPPISPTSGSRIFSSVDLRRDFYDERGTYGGPPGTDFRSSSSERGDTTSYPSRVYHSPPGSYGRASLHELGSDQGDGGLGRSFREDPYEFGDGGSRSFHSSGSHNPRTDFAGDYSGTSRMTSSGYEDDIRTSGGGYGTFGSFGSLRGGRRMAGGIEDYSDDIRPVNLEYVHEERIRDSLGSLGRHDFDATLESTSAGSFQLDSQYPTAVGLEQERYGAY